MRGTLFVATLMALVAVRGAAFADEGFTSAKLLSFAQEQQESYFNTSLIMAHAIAYGISGDLAACVEAYLVEESGSAHSRLRQALQAEPDGYPPVVLRDAVSEVCGPFAR